MVFPLNGRDGVFRFQFVGNPVSNTIFEIVRKDVTLVGDDMFLRIWFRALEVKNGSEMKFLLSKRNSVVKKKNRQDDPTFLHPIQYLNKFLCKLGINEIRSSILT